MGYKYGIDLKLPYPKYYSNSKGHSKYTSEKRDTREIKGTRIWYGYTKRWKGTRVFFTKLRRSMQGWSFLIGLFNRHLLLRLTSPRHFPICICFQLKEDQEAKGQKKNRITIFFKKKFQGSVGTFPSVENRVP